MTVTKDKIIRSDLVHYDGITKTTSRKDSTGGTISGLKHGVEVDVLQVYGSGVEYTKSTIQKAVTAISSASVTLVFNPGTWVIDDNITLTSNFVCRFPAGAIVSPASGKTITFQGPVIHDAQTWTGGSGTVTESGTRYFTGAENHSGTETHTGTESHSGTVSFTGTTTIQNYLIGICEFRLTLTTATPVTTTDVTAATTLYCSPYKGNRISLYDGTNWNMRSSVEFSIAVPATTSQMYDVFCYDNSGTPTLELTAWTNDTTRATALTTQNGVLVKTGTTTRRYLGSFRTSGVSGQTTDSLANRLVWNYYNRVERNGRGSFSTDRSTTSTSYAEINSEIRNTFVIGVSEDAVQFSISGSVYSANNAIFARTSVGIDGTTAEDAHCMTYIDVANNNQTAALSHATYVAAGYHYATLLGSISANTGNWAGSGVAGTRTTLQTLLAR